MSGTYQPPGKKKDVAETDVAETDSTNSIQQGDASRSAQKSSDSVDYEFLLSTGRPMVIDSYSRRTIRSHVMRNFIQQKVTKPDNRLSNSSVSTSEAKDNLQGRFKLKKPRALKTAS